VLFSCRLRRSKRSLAATANAPILRVSSVPPAFDPVKITLANLEA
jgi:hypothetical protein